MDQHRIAGLGNLLVDEALWRAGIDPARAAFTIDPDRRKVLHKAIRTMLRTLDRRGGSHTGDMPRALDVPCPRDGALLRRGKVGGRTTYWCPVHQHYWRWGTENLCPAPRSGVSMGSMSASYILVVVT
jgi:formamidopyrimidine-DNA glycosylase